MNSVPQLHNCLQCGTMYQVCFQGDSCIHPQCHDCLKLWHGKCTYCLAPHPHLTAEANQSRACKRKTPTPNVPPGLELMGLNQEGNGNKDTSQGHLQVSVGGFTSLPAVHNDNISDLQKVNNLFGNLHLGAVTASLGYSGFNSPAIATNTSGNANNHVLPSWDAGVGNEFDFDSTNTTYAAEFMQERGKNRVSGPAARNRKLGRPGQRYKRGGLSGQVEEHVLSVPPRRCDFSAMCRNRANLCCRVCWVKLCDEHACDHLTADQSVDHVQTAIEDGEDETFSPTNSGSPGSSPQHHQIAPSMPGDCSVQSFHGLYKFCSQCQELLCVICKISKHSWHIQFLQDVEVAALHCRDAIKQCKAEIEEYQHKLHVAREETELMVKAVDDTRLRNDQQIDKWAEEMTRLVSMIATQTKEKNNQIADRKIKALSYQKAMLDFSTQAVSKYVNQAEDALSFSEDKTKSIISFHVISSKELANQTQESVHFLKPVDDSYIFLELMQKETIGDFLSKSINVSTNGLAYPTFCSIYPEGDLWKCGFLKDEGGREKSTFQFSIQVRNHLNEPCVSTRNQIALVLKPKLSTAPEFFTQRFEKHPIQVEPAANGIYRITFLINQSGTYVATALINEVAIRNPFDVRVYRGRDYRSLNQAKMKVTNLNRAWGISTDFHGFVYVADRSNCSILKLDHDGNYVSRFGGPGCGPGEFNLAMKLVADRSGNLYVTDKENNRIQKFNYNGHFQCEFGKDSSELQLHFPWDIKINEEGKIAVTDTRNDRVVLISPDGRKIASVGLENNKDLKEPRGVCFLRNGDLLVTAFQTHQVFLIDRNFKRVTPFCKPMKECDRQIIGGFNRPSGITQDPYGNIIIADNKNNRLQVYDEEGHFITTIGPKVAVHSSRGYEYVMLNSPSDVAVSPDGCHLWVIDGDSDIRRLFRF